jgi:hypothetical protein
MKVKCPRKILHALAMMLVFYMIFYLHQMRTMQDAYVHDNLVDEEYSESWKPAITPGTNPPPLVSPPPVRRPHALLITHQLCAVSRQDNSNVFSFPIAIMNPSCASCNQNATMNVLAATASMQPDGMYMDNADFLVLFEVDGQAHPSSIYFTQCFSPTFPSNKTDLFCRVSGFGTVKAQIIFFYFSGISREARIFCDLKPLRIPMNATAAGRMQVEIFSTASNQVIELFENKISLCALGARNISKAFGCTQPLYNVQKFEKLWPGLIKMWLRHYIVVLGFARVTVYDIDGSTGAYLPQELLRSRAVIYRPRWAPTAAMRDVQVNGSTYCSETYMENQCLWEARGRSEWAMLLHAPDNFLADVPGAHKLFGYLDSKPHSFPGIPIYVRLFYGKDEDNVNHTHASEVFSSIQQFISTQCRVRSVPIVDPHICLGLFVHVESVGGICPRLACQDPPTSWVNHYMTMFRRRTTWILHDSDKLTRTNDFEDFVGEHMLYLNVTE